jgi:tRNA A37 threonylcarbamoyladenosine biosynthesis protein TsaE
MENLTVKIKRKVEVDGEITLPTYFTLNKYTHYKLLDQSNVLVVTYYTSDMHSVKALELYSSIKMENIRYLEWMVKEDNFDPLTEKEFNKYFNTCKKLLSSL